MKEKKGLFSHSGHGYFLPFVVIVTAIFGIYLLFFSHSSVLNWVRARVEIARQEKQMKALDNENALMDAEISSLQGSRDSLEKFAREQFHLASPGEDVFIVE